MQRRFCILALRYREWYRNEAPKSGKAGCDFCHPFLDVMFFLRVRVRVSASFWRVRF